MLQVDLEKCTGCGECLGACPVDAISLAAGKAAIDVDTCLACGACVGTCPEGAILEARLPVPITTAVVQPEKMITAMPVLVSGTESQFTWIRPVLSFIGHEIVPRLADAFVASLDRRLLSSSKAQATFNPPAVGQKNGERRRLRRRYRGSKFSLASEYTKQERR